MSITKMDSNGRVLLPMSIRFGLDLNGGDEFAIDQLGDGTIILKKVDERLRFEKWLNEETLNGFDNLKQ
jgi:AbrB family looped-hinge helix DNA binding protein